MSKLSIVLSVAGNDPLRRKNLLECISCIKNQTFKDFELIIVEQSLDGNLYSHNIPCDKYVHMKDPKDRGFCLSWCRNVGVVNSSSPIVVLMDGDFIFKEDYTEKINKMSPQFAGGATKYLWSRQEHVTEWERSGKNFSVFEKHWIGWTSLDAAKGIGYGGTLVFSKDFYLNILGGSTENYARYGWEDRSLCFRAMQLLGIDEKKVSRIDSFLVHLYHGNKDMGNDKVNHRLYEKEKTIHASEIAKRLKEAGIGDKKEPKYIEI